MLKLLTGSRQTIWMAVAACVVGSLAVYANVGLLAASAWLISAAALQPPLAELSVAIVGVRFFGLSRAVCRYVERYVSHDATFRLLADIRVWLYTRIEPLAPAAFLGFDKGDIFSRLVADVETLKFFYLRVLFPVCIAIISSGATLGLLAWLAAPLFYPVACAFFVAGFVIPVVIGLLSQRAGQRVVTDRAALNGALIDCIEGITELTACGQSATQATKAAVISDRLTISQRRANSVVSLADALGVLAMNLTVIVVIAVAAPLVASQALDGVYLAAAALAVQASFEALLPLPAAVYYWQESLCALTRINAIAGRSLAGNSVADNKVPAEPIEFAAHNMSFSYQPGFPALAGITFSLPPGKRLAVVGASGAGKSTLAGIMLRFWQYDQGTLLINGDEVKEYSPAAVRRVISVVSQDTYLFNASIKDNILLARPGAGDTELQAAVEGALLGELVSRLPQGLETLTGQNGLSLSGGERQRIALARALLKAAPVWLLDEPTAGLDACAEAAVMDNILHAAGGRSIMLITHRLVGLEAMDEILVLDNGVIAEQGTLQQLLAKRGYFYQMWIIQHDLLKIA